MQNKNLGTFKKTKQNKTKTKKQKKKGGSNVTKILTTFLTKYNKTGSFAEKLCLNWSRIIQQGKHWLTVKQKKWDRSMGESN